MSTFSHSLPPAPQNQLLASLPPEAAALLQPRLEAVALEAGRSLYEAGSPLKHVHFPSGSTVSLVSPLADGACAEIAVVGPEGIVGVCAFMGGGRALSSAVVQRPGPAWRMEAGAIAELARRHEPLMQGLLRYTQALFTHLAQTSACNRHHAMGPRLCTWLLQHADRQDGDTLQVTQERIAELLGVRREGITAAALRLQRAGLIGYRRGRIEVLDRRGLEAECCECHGVVREVYERLRKGSAPWPRGLPDSLFRPAPAAVGAC